MRNSAEWAKGLQRIRVLVVDDDPDLRTLLERMLRRDADVTTATTIAEAEAALARAEYDVVICDFGVAGAPGGARWHRLEAQVPDLAAHTLVMSGGAIREGDDEALEELGDRFVPKPFRAEELRAALRRVSRR